MRTLLLVALMSIAACEGAARAGAPEDDARARLARIQADPVLASDRAALDALARDADALDPTERSQAWMIVAEAYLGRLHAPEAGRSLLRRLAADPQADPLTAAQAANLVLRSELDDGLVDEARADASRLSRHVAPALAELVAARIRRRAVHRAAVAVVLAVGAALIVAIVRAARTGGGVSTWRAGRAMAPVALAFGGLVAVVGGGLAAAFSPGSAGPFAALGAVLVPLLVAARAWGAAGSSAPGPRGVRAGACAALVLAASFLVLESVDASYLASFGL